MSFQQKVTQEEENRPLHTELTNNDELHTNSESSDDDDDNDKTVDK